MAPAPQSEWQSSSPAKRLTKPPCPRVAPGLVGLGRAAHDCAGRRGTCLLAVCLPSRPPPHTQRSVRPPPPCSACCLTRAVACSIEARCAVRTTHLQRVLPGHGERGVDAQVPVAAEPRDGHGPAAVQRGEAHRRRGWGRRRGRGRAGRGLLQRHGGLQDVDMRTTTNTAGETSQQGSGRHSAA